MHKKTGPPDEPSIVREFVIEVCVLFSGGAITAAVLLLYVGLITS